jgi:RimJ/RimL family protein N-acetyltransferase
MPIDNFETPHFIGARTEGFETEHLLVRRTVEGDRDSLTPILTNLDVVQGMGQDEPPDSSSLDAFIAYSTAAWELGVCWTFTIVEKDSERIVGFARMEARPSDRGGNQTQAEPTIGIGPGFRNRGYAYEVMAGLIMWTFEELEPWSNIVLDEVRAACLPSNEASLGLLRKLAAVGMEDLGEQQVRKSYPDTNETTTVHIFSITREDATNTRAPKQSRD